MAKLEQNRHGLFPGAKHGSTGGPGTGKFKNTVKRKAGEVKRAIGDVASNVKEKIKSSKTPKEPTLTINTSDNSNTTIGRDTNPSASDRYSEIMLGQPLADPNAYAAMLAGGSRPMTAMDNSQVDPKTGMPITPGGQASMNSNFIGGIANSNMPTTGMLAQEKYDAAKADLNNNGVTEDWEKAKAQKFTVAQDGNMMRTMRPLKPAVDKKVPTIPAQNPGVYNSYDLSKPEPNEFDVKTSSGTRLGSGGDSEVAWRSYANEVANDRTESGKGISAKGLSSLMHLERHGQTSRMNSGPLKSPTEKINDGFKKGYDTYLEKPKVNSNIDQQRLTQSRRGTKCMRVKKK